MKAIKHKARRIDNGQWVNGYYFISPLTNETGEADCFLSGRRKHQIANEYGVVFEIDIRTLEESLDDFTIKMRAFKKTKRYKILSIYYWIEIRVVEFIYKIKYLIKKKK